MKARAGSMRLVEAARPVFARHETFHPRYGWFRKAYAAAARDPGIFSHEDAPTEIGVGKNMVRSIRFWGLAAKLIVEDHRSADRRAPSFVPTRFGHALFGPSGWDRFMEDPGTLWLLHWRLLAPPSRLPVWWLAFNEFGAVEFDDDDLESATAAYVEAAAGWKTPHRSSLRKDVSALIRTYAPAERSGGTGGRAGGTGRGRRGSLDDILDCPLRELGLIGRSEATGRHRFSLGPKPTLPAAVIAFALLDYIARTGAGGNTATLSRLASEPGAPGCAFKLNESELLAAVEPVIERTDYLDLARPTGASQLAWSEEPEVIATTILEDYYGREADDVVAGPAGDDPIDDDLVDELGMGRDAPDSMRRLWAASQSPAEGSSAETTPTAGVHKLEAESLSTAGVR